jgi:hypothetical protein
VDNRIGLAESLGGNLELLGAERLLAFIGKRSGGNSIRMGLRQCQARGKRDT